jgi:hypothetical protein
MEQAGATIDLPLTTVQKRDAARKITVDERGVNTAGS